MTKGTDAVHYSTNVYAINTGYGYEVKLGEKVLIKQDHIPAVSEQHTFCNEDDAQNIAELVVLKLKNKENPRVTKAELQAKAITLDCLN
ncbi:hypothetical protein BN863_16680 [Formosa agariphila KMM 3901]|uniref:DUF4907 domain-containing protein n=1 Tax=Formosa agariphila (strain DSM 15362 / KCTC 12365 / LMG 23005 / KMM 3901 / M-2Alg 35-1) TaxID=1347342 RepID=T2KKX7_FORAG|nr:hypothetical protein BN863_16680 [Formosa agariphila KMM 3901]